MCYNDDGRIILLDSLELRMEVFVPSSILKCNYKGSKIVYERGYQLVSIY